MPCCVVLHMLCYAMLLITCLQLAVSCGPTLCVLMLCFVALCYMLCCDAMLCCVLACRVMLCYVMSRYVALLCLISMQFWPADPETEREREEQLICKQG